MLHVSSTRVAEGLLGVKSNYGSVLIVQWQLSPWLGVLQVAAVLSVWVHACIGVHFWLRIKAWYARWQLPGDRVAARRRSGWPRHQRPQVGSGIGRRPRTAG
jgi:hypothetical protein